MKQINSAFEVFKAIGGTCGAMADAGIFHYRTKGKAGKYVGEAVPKLTRQYGKRYKHVLSDYLAEKQLSRLQAAKAV